MTDILGGNLDDARLLQANKTKDVTLIMPVMYVENTNVSKEQEAVGWRLEEQKKECYPSLSRPHRKVFFLICNLIGIICYIIAMSLVDRLYLIVPWHISASSFFILSMMFLWGPTDFVKHICTLQGTLFTIIYGSAIGGVLYFGHGYYWRMSEYVIMIMICQIAILLWFIVSNIPGGSAFVIFLWTWMCEKVDKLLPII